MGSLNKQSTRFLIAIPLIFLLASCAAGHSQFTEITRWILVSGVIRDHRGHRTGDPHLQRRRRGIRSQNNTGGWYDFGFLLGVICIWGGGSSANCKSYSRKQREKEWDEVGDKVEKKVMRKLKAWAETEE